MSRTGYPSPGRTESVSYAFRISRRLRMHSISGFMPSSRAIDRASSFIFVAFPTRSSVTGSADVGA